MITGASSGLGLEMARRLARVEKACLILAARRRERLEALKTELEQENGVRAIVLETDVASGEQAERLFREATAAADGGIYALINNAGTTFYGAAASAQLQTFENICDVNFRAVMRLSLLFLDYFRERGGGAILNVTSEAAFIPLPYQAVYSATKHAAQAFTEALRTENAGSSVIICSFAPGGLATEMITRSGLDKKHGLDSPVHMKASVAARIAIHGFKRKKRVVVPGMMNKLTVVLFRLFPRCWSSRVAEMIYRPPSGRD